MSHESNATTSVAETPQDIPSDTGHMLSSDEKLDTQVTCDVSPVEASGRQTIATERDSPVPKRSLKLRTDPILTSDVDPRTACYVRFYHDKFQKDRPELLHQIRRATKSDQQSKDEVESLKGEVCKLKECIGQMSHRINTLSNEYEKVTALLTEILTRQQQQQQHLQQQIQHSVTPAGASTEITTSSQPTQQGQANTGGCTDLMHSLSQVAAFSLQNHLRAAESGSDTGKGCSKRHLSEHEHQPSSSKQRTN
eukprot:scaffold4529_cov121-Cylindrotheca_fusiformis.AAC.7